VVALELCRELRDRGHNSKLITTDADGSGRLDQPGTIRGRTPDLDIEIHRVHAPRKLMASLGLWAAIRREVKARDVVYIHQIYFFSTWAAAREARRAGVPYLVQPHGSLEPYQREKSRVVKWYWDHTVGRRLFRDAAGFICASESEAEGAAPVIGTTRSHVAPLGATVGPGHVLAPVVDGPFVLFLGRIAPKKRIDVLIAAFAEVAPNWNGTLVIAGEGDESLTAQLKAQAALLLPAARVRFLGPVAAARKDWLLRNARAFVLSSENENFAIAVAESLVAGTPVIVTPHVATHRIVQRFNAGLVVDLGTRAVAAALESLLHDDALHAELSRGAVAAGQELQWTRTTDAVERAVLQVLGTPGGTATPNSSRGQTPDRNTT
jgi:glycosyltransferase involved in cell wall biosynthesis